MARIRSVHPGLFTDEAFMAASSHARLLMIGLWTEADDQGIFDWKPLTLKARLLPADTVDVSSLLAELEAADTICRFESNGKSYGAIRNFRKFQRPQKPHAQHPLPECLVAYVGLSGSDPIPIADQSPTPPVKSPQMKEKGKEKDEITAQAPVGVSFEDFWRAYPRRDGPNPKKPAEISFSRAIRRGADPQHIISGAKSLRGQHPSPTPFVPQAVTWLNQERWKDMEPTGPPPGLGPPVEEILARARRAANG